MARTEPRVGPVTEPDEEQAQALAAVMASAHGRPANIFATMAHHPVLLKRFNVLGGLFMSRNLIPPRDRELVILRVAWRLNCAYEWTQHQPLAVGLGMNMDELHELTRESPAAAERDQAILQFADELLQRTTVDDAAWFAVAEFFDDAQMLELVMLIGFYRMAAGFLNAVGVQVEEGLAGWETRL